MKRRSSFQFKLYLILGATGIGSMLLVGGALLIHERLTFRQRVLDSLDALVAMISVTTRAALDFDDAATAQENLATLAEHRDLLSATLYSASGQPLASYLAPGQESPSPAAPNHEFTRFDRNGVAVHRTLRYNGRIIGHLLIESSFASQRAQFDRSLRILGALGVGALLVLLLWARFLQRMFSAPLVRLTEVADEVRGSKNFSLRAPITSRDEVGRLADSFNGLLADLAERDQQIALELTARRASEAALSESEERFRQLVENSNDLIVLTDSNGVILYASPNHTVITGRDPGDLVGGNVLDHIHPEDLRTITTNFERTAASFSYRARLKNGEWRWFETSGRSFTNKDGEARNVVISRDITKRVEAEKKQEALEFQLRHAQKMEAVGTLAGGIAHDFNNILTGIMGNIELARMDLPDVHPCIPALGDATKASQRARELVKQILAFSRQGEQIKSPTDLGPLVREAMRLLRSSLPTTIVIHTEIEDGCPPILCDATQIHQVLMNLGTNAAHAMRKRGINLRVGLKRVSLTPADLAAHRQLLPEHTVCLTVADEGTGMDQATMERIFEPFFTTKAAGEGTGLGLSMVHGIVQDHGGAIVIESRLGFGTTFKIYFPGAACAAVPESITTSRVAQGQGEIILLIDDDVLVANVAAKLLSRLGYVAETYVRPAEALQAMQRQPNRYSLVITDLTMPGMTGVELAREAIKVRANLPIIIATGYLRDDAPDEARQFGIRHFVRKPYDRDELGRVVRDAINRNKNLQQA
ncbi:MAG: hypothetical protein QG602_2641 [Verrucomicrobiota bacterium]|nr:hypothetical protein [Verrucomicrobiota bacterium]